jgi:peptide/nickel transport system permease protein
MADGGRLRRAARQILGAAVALWLVASLTFFAVRLAPGDPARSTDPTVSGADSARHAEAVRKLYGLDRPLASQYVNWLGGLLEADLGWSFHYRRPVADVIGTALPPTLGLAGLALALQYGGALVLAVVAAGSRSRIRSASDLLATLLYAVPSFWLGLLALRWPGHAWDWFPTHGARSAGPRELLAQFADAAHHAALPALVLALANFGLVYRLSASALRDSLSSPYVLAARARGVSELRLLWVHALRNAGTAAIHRLGLDLPVLLSGSLVLEVLFSRPGLGRVAHQAFLARDFPLLAAGATAAGALVITGSVIADVLQRMVDPRVGDA